MRAAYERGETDEFIQPTLVGEEGRIRDGDAVVFFNFRPDRARQLTRALGEDDFAEFDLGERPRVALTTLTSYQEDWDYPVAFPPARPSLTLASVLAERGIAQLHVAETEKYAHVTYFFNGGEENPYEGEERRLVDSPRDVATYDEKPEMSAEAAADAFVEELGGAATSASASSTSRTRTWSATPATSPRPCAPSRPWTAASAACWRRCTPRAAPAS